MRILLLLLIVVLGKTAVSQEDIGFMVRQEGNSYSLVNNNGVVICSLDELNITTAEYVEMIQATDLPAPDKNLTIRILQMKGTEGIHSEIRSLSKSFPAINSAVLNLYDNKLLEKFGKRKLKKLKKVKA